jgi:hypothetical protein
LVDGTNYNQQAWSLLDYRQITRLESPHENPTEARGIQVYLTRHSATSYSDVAKLVIM